MWQALAGLANIGGSVLGGIGASQRASALEAAIGKNIKDVKKFTGEQVDKSNKLGATKQTYLEEGDPFADMGKFIFGDPSKNTYQNLRKSQSDFAELAAGNTANFSKEVSNIVQGALANTFGGPRGSFENLSAKNLFNFRQGGVNTALGLTNFFNQTGSQLTNAKFGILDQGYERELALRQNELNQINALRMGQAEQSGVPMMSFGNVLNAAGGAASNYGSYLQNLEALKQQKLYGDRYLGILEKRQDGIQGGGGYQSAPTAGYTPMRTTNTNVSWGDGTGGIGITDQFQGTPSYMSSLFGVNQSVYPYMSQRGRNALDMTAAYLSPASVVNGDAPSLLPPL